jgi:hypothetical protein
LIGLELTEHSIRWVRAVRSDATCSEILVAAMTEVRPPLQAKVKREPKKQAKT